MSYAARLPIAADRYTPCVRTVIFRGIDLRGRTLRMQLRLATDTPGAPLVDLGSVDNAQAQGLALITVTQDGAVPVSTVQIRVNESTMKGLPYSGEMGSATALEYDLITTIGGDKRILMRGAFVIEAGVTGADNAPANRPYGYGSTDGLGGMRTSATLTFGETSIAINIDGADLIAPLKQDAEAARDAAVSARNAAAGERAGAEAARDQAEISRDVATTTQPTYASQAAGEAATTAGKLFVVAPGDGTAQMRRRTAGGSDKLYEFLTNTYVPPVGAPAIRRLLRDRIGETASIKDYVVGKGDVDDTDAYSEAMILGVREWLYPDGCSINISRPVNWLGERTHRFADNARIIAEVEGYGVRALGYPDLLPSVVQDPIPRGSMAFTATNIGDLAVDEDFYLYDVSLQEYDVNTVRKKVGNTIFTKRPINFSFDQPTNTRIYRLANACRNVKVFGGEFRNERQSLTAHALGFLNATDIFLQDTVATKSGGIGIGFEVSMRLFTRSVAAIETGAVGMGHRNVKEFSHHSFVGRNPGHDESLTFFKNCTNGEVISPDIAQYLNGEAPQGSLGLAGNCILLDERCDDITIRDARLRGSGTYAIFINNGSNRNRVFNADIQFANLGGIRIARDSHDNVIRGGHIRDIVDAMDAEVAPAPGLQTAAIQDDGTCTGNVLGEGTQISRVGGGVAVRQTGTRGLVVHHGDGDYRGGKFSVSTRDWDEVTQKGTRLVAQPAAPNGNTYLRLIGESRGGNDYTAVSISAIGAPPADLVGIGDVVVSIPDGRPYMTYRDFTGVTKTMPAPLGSQVGAQQDSAAATVEGLRADFNALLTNMRTAKLMSA